MKKIYNHDVLMQFFDWKKFEDERRAPETYWAFKVVVSYLRSLYRVAADRKKNQDAMNKKLLRKIARLERQISELNTGS